MHDNRKKIIVGAFILIGLLIFLVGVFTLGSQKKAFGNRIQVSVVFDDIQGLKAGNNVVFSGVKVGTVKKIQFYGTSQVMVTMTIEEEAQHYIHKDAGASIGSDGLIGDKQVVIDGGTTRLPNVEDGDKLHVNATLSTDEIMKTFQENNQNLLAITSDFKKISANLVSGKGPAGAMLSDEKMASDIRIALANLKATTENANQMVMQLNNFGRKLNTKGGLADKISTDTVVFARFQASVNELQEATRSASQLANNLTNASKKLNQTDNPTGLLLNDQNSADQLRRIMKNLEASSYNLNENMKALQQNFLFRGYFRKKKAGELDQE